MSVDPLTSGYPELTPYQFAHNRPIEFIDIDGLEGTRPNTFSTRTELRVHSEEWFNEAVERYPNRLRDELNYAKGWYDWERPLTMHVIRRFI